MEKYLFLYGGPFLEGFFITLFLLAALLFMGRFFPLPVRDGSAIELPRIGGWALVVTFLVVILSSETLSLSPAWWSFCLVLVGILFLGVWDDYHPLSWKTQAFWQSIFVILLYLGGVHIFSLTHPLGGVWLVPNATIFSLGFLMFFCFALLVVNALNWLDGADGLCGSLAGITYVTFFILCLGPVVDQPALAIVSATLAGSTLAFLVYNFPRARLFAGTTGVLFFGFTIFFLSVIAGTKIATALLVLVLPLLDACFVLLKRFLAGQRLTQRDQLHLHHVLLARGWSPRKIVTAYAGLTLFVAGVSLQTMALGKLSAILLVFLSVGLFLFHFHFPRAPYRKQVLTAGFALSVLLCMAAIVVANNVPTKVVVDGAVFVLEAAKTPEEQARGLSNRDSLCGNCGMLFEFSDPGLHSFWMKDMRFSLDVIWLDENNQVVAKYENLPFPSLEPFGPPVPVVRVLELPAGAATSVRVGERLLFW
jgi:UDP-GlcNAc:undecaprenyl-phosphate GlcNAc-1-phosphate transferase